MKRNIEKFAVIVAVTLYAVLPFCAVAVTVIGTGGYDVFPACGRDYAISAAYWGAIGLLNVYLWRNM